MTDIPKSIDAVIVGAGFAGLYMLHRMRKQGISAVVLESADGVGGTWYWNRYPGARVDIESQEYSYWFSSALDEEWKWTERYSPQPEILKYANHVADRFDLRRDIRFNTRVKSATFDEGSGRWTVTTDKGDSTVAHYCIMATGCLSVPKEPDFVGIDSFKGKSYFTSRWPHEEVNFTGMRVGVIGTGSSAIQSIPVMATQAKHLTVFQRTPNYSVPAHNHPIDAATEELWKLNRARFRAEALANGVGIRQVDPEDRLTLVTPPEERDRILEDRWARGGFAMLGGFADMGIDEAANKIGAAFFAKKIRGIVKDPKVAEKLVPKSYPLGTKRLCVDTGYFETFNRPNVSLVDVAAAPIREITPKGIRTSDAEYEFDAIVYAIGFDAMTGALDKIDITGRKGTRLKKKWSEGPRTYLGLMVSGFPNFFTVTGPGSPSVLSNMLPSIEHHVDWIINCIASLKASRHATIEATEPAEDAWVAHVNEVASMTLYPRANSWYMGANVPGKPRVFLPYVGGVPEYRRKCAEVAVNGYEGFKIA
ncbi:MAG: NAD(P)/FAD-dependent oxidoreductase [Micropepsaceae bacterium]